MPVLSAITINAQTEIAGTRLQQSNSGITKYDNNSGLRGIISSESGHALQHLNVQRAIILPHRQDGKDYTGILTFSASKPVEIVLSHRIEIDKSALSTINTKKFGSLFIVSPIHPHAGYVLSASSVLKPEYGGFLAPYYSASIPFVASSVILRTLGAVPFVAAYEVSVQLGQPHIINNLTTAQNLTTTNTR